MGSMKPSACRMGAACQTQAAREGKRLTERENGQSARIVCPAMARLRSRRAKAVPEEHGQARCPRRTDGNPGGAGQWLRRTSRYGPAGHSAPGVASLPVAWYARHTT